MTNFDLNWSMSLAALPLPFAEALRWVADKGFTQVEITLATEPTPEQYEQLADSGLFVSSVVLPLPASADATRDQQVGDSREDLRRRLDAAAKMGARGIVLCAEQCSDAEGQARLFESCTDLALEAAVRFMTLCVANDHAFAFGNLVGAPWDIGSGKPPPPSAELVHVRLALAENPDEASVAAIRGLRARQYRGPVVVSTVGDWRLLPEMLWRLEKAAFIDVLPE